MIDKPIRVGDFIELDSGEQGFVEKIGWRSTWIRMLPNNTVIIPNSVLSQSKIINYFYPEVEDYETFVVFHTFDNSSINFTVILRAQEYFNRFFIKSEFIKALHKRYREEGIVIPYPIRAVNLDQENAAANFKD